MILKATIQDIEETAEEARQNNILEGDNTYKEYYIEVESRNNNHLKNYQYLEAVEDYIIPS